MYPLYDQNLGFLTRRPVWCRLAPSDSILERFYTKVSYNDTMAQYVAWELLDHSRRHSIVDTMALVDLHRHALDSLYGLQDALAGSPMIIVPETMEETAHKCRDLGGLDDSDEFIHSMEHRLAEAGIEYFLAELPDATCLSAIGQYVREEYPDRNGEPLSFVDCLLLCAAVSHDNVDIITADGALAGAIGERCGQDRVDTPRIDYYKRRDDTKWIVNKLSGKKIVWVEEGTELRYEAEGETVVTLDTSSRDARLVSCDIPGKPCAGESIRTYFMEIIDVLRCRGCGCEPFGCKCPDFPYYPDGGSDNEASAKFLDALPARERDELHALVKSFFG